MQWKCRFDAVLTPSKKLYALWNKFSEFLTRQHIEMIVDFKQNVELVYEVSSNGKYTKKKVKDGKIIFKLDNKRYG